MSIQKILKRIEHLQASKWYSSTLCEQILQGEDILFLETKGYKVIIRQDCKRFPFEIRFEK